ncbi:MAG: HlyD family efflux transporter periplasmic adaptor subunit [Acidobacteria bacterium]|nr:HlyD family efflux transporter periplasmic adaptor subunit [Acidobacteriota bacterium]
MRPKPVFARWAVAAASGAIVIAAAVLTFGRQSTATPEVSRRESTAIVARRDFVRSVRLSGTVEAVESSTIATPRLSGPGTQSLVITRLVKGGAPVAKGDLIVEFDRQTQIAAALDRRAEVNDLDQQIRKREAAERAALAKDDTEIAVAENAVARAKLEVLKNEMLARVQAEKNQLALEQAGATVKQLKATYALKRKAAAADQQILAIRRARAENAMRQAEANADKMAVRASIDGMAVIRTVFRMGTPTEVQEGEEVRAGMPVVDIVNPAKMRIRARVNQADINDLKVGQPVRVGLDAYPNLFFDGRIAQISPIGLVSTLSPKVRIFVVLVDIHGTHPSLMPDLTAWCDVELGRIPGALVVPRDALRSDGDRVYVHVRRGSSYRDQPITVGMLGAHEAAVSGIEEGAVLSRNAGARDER